MIDFLRFLVNSTADEFGLVDGTLCFVSSDNTACSSIARIFGFDLPSSMEDFLLQKMFQNSDVFF